MKLPKTDSLEINEFKVLVKKGIALLDTKVIKRQYKRNTLVTIPSPFDDKLVKFIIGRLKRNVPTSIIRLGDGEMNLLASSKYPELPNLSLFAALSSIKEQKHSFTPTETWLLVLEEMMMSALLEADVVGILGFWRPHIETDEFIPSIVKNPRGYWGQWIGLEHILQLHRQHIFKQKMVASAHLYFSILKYLDVLFAHVKNIYLITNKKKTFNYLEKKFPANNFKLIFEPVSKTTVVTKEPDFLSHVAKKLPNDMSGSLTLVGAGVWAEYYCSWIKRRGGVAIDIGSGFDLLMGHTVRPIHQFYNG